MNAEADLKNMTFQRLSEPREGAFNLLVPAGWQLEGGIVRGDLSRQVVSAQTIAAKVDFAVKRDAQGSVMIRWCPEILYCDMRYSPVGGMGFFPPGSNYMGTIVWPIMSAQDFITQMLFPWAHPQASQANMEAQESLPKWVEEYRQQVIAHGLMANLQYDAACVTMTYTEGGVRYREKAYTIIEAMFPLGVGTWSNKNAFCLRAPEDEFTAWEPVLMFMRASAQQNYQWQAMEVVNQ